MLAKGTEGEEKGHDSANPSHAKMHHFALLNLGPHHPRRWCEDNH